MQKKKSKVSVLINNHNYGAYIGEAIDSVLNQTYKDYEIIIIDGASTDNSRAVISSYAEKYPQLITAVFKNTSGQAAAINLAFQLCKGDIIAFLDSDDYYFEGKLERIVSWHETYDFIGHARKITDSKGQLLESVAAADVYELRPELLKKYGYIYTYNLITSCISVKRELLKKILPMPEDGYTTFADCYIKVLAQYYSNIKYIAEPLSYYRIHEVQKTNSFAGREKLNQFVEQLYQQVFSDVNEVLQKRGEPLIPEMSGINLRKGLSLANPGLIIHANENYVIYGTGNNAYKVKKYMEQLGGKCIYALDSNSEKWGAEWNGVKILSFEELLDKRSQYQQILIASVYYNAMEQTLEELGLHKAEDFVTVHSIPND